jgi:hypothetical protein
VTRRALAALAGLLALTACGTAKVDNPGFVKDLQANKSAEVTVSGTVSQLLADYTGPTGPHEYFDVSVDGHQVKVDYNLGLAPRIPLEVGAAVQVHGEFNPDPGDPNIDYVHKSTGGHESGWVELNGKKYW